MNHAPSVHFPVGRSRFGVRALALAWLAGCLSIAMWVLLSQAFNWRHALGLASVLATGVLAARAIAGLEQGRLHWTGQEWLWSSDAESEQGHVTVDLDFQGIILARFRGGGPRARWIWLERRQAPHLWGDLRRALYARDRSAAGLPRPEFQ